MERQHKKSKKLLWILPGVGLAVIAAAAVLLCVLLRGEKTQTEAAGSKLYWNVERGRYVAQGYLGVSSRTKNNDGYYHVNMAVDGEQIDVLVESTALINRIDFQEVMGLTFDENGIVDGILELDAFTGGIVADKYAVQSVDGNTIVCNTSTKYKGLKLTFEINENTRIWEIGDFEPMVGLPCTIEEGDQVLMIQDYEGNITDVYVFPFIAPGDVYWNINRMYDSTSQCTTRERDQLGFFVYEFAVNGEIVTLKTSDQSIADYIDKHVSQCMGFNFDENGYIIEVLSAGNTVCGGGLFADRYNVTGLNGDEITLAKNGTVLSAAISKDCKFFDVSGQGEYVGVPVDGTQYGDRVICLKDRRDQLCVVFITARLTSDDIYWVVERNDVWDRTNWVTTRKPAADGWYYIKLAVNGKQITVKSKDAQLVNELDSYVCWCVELEDDVIVSIQDATNHYGGSLFGVFNKVVSIKDNQLTIQKTSTTSTATMSSDCVVYNVSANSNIVGEQTTVQEDDTIYGFTDMDGVVRYIFVTSRPYREHIYWNVTQMYDFEKNVSTRERASDGYYYFEMVCDGKVVWLKTAEKEIADNVDRVITRARGLKVVDGVIKQVLAPNQLVNYEGVTPDASWVTVQSVNGRTLTAVNSKNETVKITLASGCKIYNVTSAYEDHRGETTTIQEGDVLVTLADRDGKAVIAYVCGGRTKAFNTVRQSCPCTQNVTWKAWDGTGPLTGGYYYLTKNVTAPESGFVIDGTTVYLRMDGHTITAGGRAFTVKNGAMLSICDHDTRGAIIGTGTVNDSGGLIQIANSNATVNLYNINVYAKDCAVENGGAISASGWLNLYNVNVYDGTAVKKGGNIAVMPTGTLRMFGGSVSGGTAAADGNNLYIAGNAYLENVTITGGVSASAANKIFMVSGGTVAGGSYGVNLLTGSLSLSGSVNIFGNESYNLRLAADTVLDVSGLAADAKIGITMAQTGVFAGNAKESQASTFLSDDADRIVLYTDNTLLLRANHCHSLCQGGQEIGFTRLTQTMFDEATSTSSPVKLSGTNYALSAGSYYLSEDITLAGQILLYDEANLCLNGHSLTASDSRAFALTGAKLSITDCGENGTINGGTADSGAAILVQASKGGANGEPSELNIYSGTVIGGTADNAASGHGGNILIYCGTFNFYGGTLTGGTAKLNGGTVYVGADQALNLYGGTVTSGTAAAGGCVYAANGAKVTLSGLITVEEIYLPGVQLTVEHLEEGSSVGIRAVQPGVIAENITRDISGLFTCGEDNTVTYNSENRTLNYGFSHVHCVCGGLEGHVCTEQPWMGLTEEDIINGNYLTDGSMCYYLKEDVHLTKAITLISGKRLTLCLNGKKLTAAAGVRAIVLSGGSLNLTDCGETGTVQATSSGSGAAVLVQGSKGGANGNLATLNIYGGTIVGGTATGTFGGCVAVTGGSFTMYGGTLAGGTAKTQGGTVYVGANQTLNLYGGTVTSGTAAAGNCVYAATNANVTLGGNVYVMDIYLADGAAVTLSTETALTDAKVGITMAVPGIFASELETDLSGSFTSTAAGAAVLYDSENKTLSLQFGHYHCLCNGTLADHSCENTVWTALTADAFSSATSSSSPVKITSGTYRIEAGNYYLEESIQLDKQIVLVTDVKLCLNGNTLSATSTRVCAVSGGTLSITDCGQTGTVRGGAATMAATFLVQKVSNKSGTLNIYGGTIIGGTTTDSATGQGGNIYVTGGQMNLYGGKLVGGKAAGQGGNVIIAANQVLNIYGGEMTSGTAAKGNCLYVVAGANVTLDGLIRIEHIYLSGATLNIANIAEGSEMAAISTSKTGVFAENQTDDFSAFFTPDTGYRVIYSTEDKTLSISAAN